MTRSSKVVMIIAIVLTVAVMAGVIVWLAVRLNDESMRAEAARREVRNACESALYDSLDSVGEMENNLAKLMASDSAASDIVIAADIYKSAGAASEAVGRLPVDPQRYEGLRKFLNQVGDFAACYIRALGEGADTDEYESLVETVFDATADVHMTLSSAVGRVGAGDYSVLEAIDAEGVIDFCGDMAVEYPGMIYDGPFSDSTRPKTWRAADGKADISEEDAVRTAEEKLGMTDCTVTGLTSGDAELYQIEGNVRGNSAYASVMKKGGTIASAVVSGGTGMAELDEERATARAVEHAEALGYGKLEPVWYEATEGTATVNLAPVQDGAVLYPDLVKIKVELTHGELMGVEAFSYCSDHRERTLPEARMTADSARTCVSPRLTVRSVRLAVIPKDGDEVLCYEAACTMRGLDYFVYVDAVTGRQVDVLRVIDGKTV